MCVCVWWGGKKGVTKLFDLYCQHSPLTNHWYVYAMQLDFVLLVLEMSWTCHWMSSLSWGHSGDMGVVVHIESWILSISSFLSHYDELFGNLPSLYQRILMSSAEDGMATIFITGCSLHNGDGTTAGKNICLLKWRCLKYINPKRREQQTSS